MGRIGYRHEVSQKRRNSLPVPILRAIPIPDGINRVRPTFGPLVVGMIQVQSNQSPNEGNEGNDAQPQETPSLCA